MSKSIQLQIPNPCSASWRAMSPTANGRYCSSCAKEVVDFTNSNDEVIANYMQANASSHICGRFNTSQLSRPLKVAPTISAYSRYGKWIVAALLLGSSHLAFANELAVLQTQQVVFADAIKIEQDCVEIVHEQKQAYYTIKGRIVDDETGEELLGASIYAVGLELGTVSDLDGNFQLQIPLDVLELVDTLQFAYVGFKQQNFVLTAQHKANLVEHRQIELKPIKMSYSDVILAGVVVIGAVRPIEKKKRKKRRHK